jgi:hypothetical protein
MRHGMACSQSEHLSNSIAEPRSGIEGIQHFDLYHLVAPLSRLFNDLSSNVDN